MNILSTTTVKNGDLLAIMNKQGEVQALLNLICADDFNSFMRLTGKRQKDLLRLSRAAANDLGELTASCLAARAAKAAKANVTDFAEVTA